MRTFLYWTFRLAFFTVVFLCVLALANAAITTLGVALSR